MNIDIKDMHILCKHLGDQWLQDMRESFRSMGADYDRGDTVIINENILPEVKMYTLPKQVIASPFLPDDVAGMVVKGTAKMSMPRITFFEDHIC